MIVKSLLSTETADQHSASARRFISFQKINTGVELGILLRRPTFKKYNLMPMRRFRPLKKSEKFATMKQFSSFKLMPTIAFTKITKLIFFLQIIFLDMYLLIENEV
jgi:hypothetical protein